ncbi:MAG: hypothetical protein V4501_01450 [Pseudomonadota bacterium]
MKSRSSFFFTTTPTNYRSLAVLRDNKEEDDDYALDIETNAANRIDQQAALLTQDATAFKITRGQLAAQKQLLKKANTIAANIKIQILKHNRQLTHYATQLETTDPLDDNAIAQLTLKRSKAENDLTHVLLRNDKVTLEIPRIESALHQIEHLNSAAGEKFIKHYPWQFSINKLMYQSFIAVEISFVPFTLKTAGLSVISGAAAWKLPQPSADLAFWVALPLAICDSAFSILLYNSHIFAVNDVFNFYEKHKLQTYQRILFNSILDSFRGFSATALALGAFDQLAINEHNFLGGASIIIGLKDYWLFKEMGKWALLFGIPALLSAVGFYGVIIDPKYKDGMKDNKAYKQVLNTFLKLFSKDFSRGFDVLYRGLFTNAFLRALMFYYLASQVRDMSEHLLWVDPIVAFALIFHHSIASRYKGAYEPSFGKKEYELIPIFVDLKIKKAREQIIEPKINSIYQSLVARNSRKKRNKQSDEQLRLAAKAQFNSTLIPEIQDELELETLKLAAGMTHLNYSHYAKITIEREKQRALRKIRAQAEIEATEYLEDQIEQLVELWTWHDLAIDLRDSVVIGSLRALFGYILMLTYGMKLVEAIDSDYVSEETNQFIKITSSLTVAMLFFGIYFNSCKQSALEARAVACHIEDDIDSDIEEIIAADNKTEQALGESKAEIEVRALATETAPAINSNNIRSKYSMRAILNMGTGLALTIAGGSWIIRLVSGEYQTEFPFIGYLDEMTLVSLITLSLAEQGVLNLNIFYPDLAETILSTLLSSKYLQEQERPNPQPVTSSRNFAFYLRNPWAMFSSTAVATTTSSNTAQLEILPDENEMKVSVQLSSGTSPRLNG